MRNVQYTGTVVDKDKQPVPGVNVIITGTGLGSITNVDGKYSIEAPQRLPRA